MAPLLFFWAESVNGKHPPWRRLALLYALPLIFASIVVILVATRLHAGAYPPGFGLHKIFAKTRGNADLLERTQQNLAILTAWLRQSGNWLFAAIFIVSGAMAVGRRRSHLIVLAALVILWFSAMLCTATFLPERNWTPALYIAAIVVGWGVAEVATAISQWDGAHFACRKAIFAGITGAVLLVFAILMLPSDQSIITINSRELEQSCLEGLSAAADYLTDHLLYEDAQVVLLHVGDYTRLKAYLPHDLIGRVRQVHLVDRRSQDITAQMAYLAEWSNDTAVTYVVVESAANFGAAWQTSFPLARRVAEFAIPDSDYPTQIWRLALVD